VLPTPKTLLDEEEEDEPPRQPARNKVDNNIAIIEYFFMRLLRC
tara:strand:- start:30 stop:161 length:132 start_codon:yes stop_codon:yes gene_type:complete